MRVRAALVTVCVAATLAQGAPSLATISGSLQAHCEVGFPAFPGVNHATCDDGTLPATSAASLSGTDDQGNPYVVSGTGTFAASFDYAAFCTAAGPPPSIWAAHGQFQAGRLFSTNGTATLTADFDLTVIGTAGMVQTTHSTISFANGGTATGVMGDAGPVTFTPVYSTGNACPGTAPMKGTLDWSDSEAS